MLVLRATPYVLLLPLAALVVHVLEELGDFPAWATARFGTTTPAWFVLSHIPLLAAAAFISWRAFAPSRNYRAVWWLLVLVWALFGNALFHVGASIIWREYSPGLLSSVVLYIPLTAYLAPRLGRALDPSRAAAHACVTGLLLAAAFVGSLWLDIPVG